MDCDCVPPCQYEGDSWTCESCGRVWTYNIEYITDEWDDVIAIDDWYAPENGW